MGNLKFLKYLKLKRKTKCGFWVDFENKKENSTLGYNPNNYSENLLDWLILKL